MTGNQVGMIVGGSFGLVYVLVNAAALGAPVGPMLQVLGVAAFVGLLVVLLRRGSTEIGGGPPQFGRGYWLVVGAEVVAIVLGAQVFTAWGLPPLPWVTVVVGLHFLPLARMWGNPFLGGVGVALTACGVIGLVVAVAGGSAAAVAAIAGVAPGAVLLAGAWAGAVWGARLEQGAR